MNNLLKIPTISATLKYANMTGFLIITLAAISNLYASYSCGNQCLHTVPEQIYRYYNNKPAAQPGCDYFIKNCWPQLKEPLNTLMTATDPNKAYDALTQLFNYFCEDQNRDNALYWLGINLSMHLIPVLNVCGPASALQDIINTLTANGLISPGAPGAPPTFNAGAWKDKTQFARGRGINPYSYVVY